MTYALGWKTEHEAFLAADTVITTRGDSVALNREQTSFGEKHHKDARHKAEESYLKLFLKSNVGVSFAGDVRLARDMIKTFYEEIEGKGSTPLDALKWSVSTHCPSPLPVDESVVLIVAFYTDGHPRLLSFNSQNDHKIREDEVLVQAGSMPKNYKEFTEFALTGIVPNTHGKPNHHLASMLGIFQAYSIFDSLLASSGVGGAFSGLYIGASGGSWQPDILYLLPDKLVSTLFRNDCFLIPSPTIGASACFMSYIPPKPMSEIEKQTQEAVEEAKGVMKEAKFDFAVVVDKEGETLTLLDMQKNREHEYLRLSWFERDEGKGIRVSQLPQLEEIIKKKTLFKNIPYMKPTYDTYTAEEVIIEEVNHN